MEIGEGEVVGLLGNNGSGKTTLLSILSGMTKRDSGQINLSSYYICDTKNYLKKLRVLQSSPSFYENLTGIQNLSIFCKKENMNKFYEIYKRFDELNSLKKKFRKFSLGMKRRFAIALVFSCDVPFILLDEPLNGLDQESTFIFEDLMINHKKKGGSAIITTHQRSYMESYCDYFLKIQGSSIVKQNYFTENTSTFYIKSKDVLDDVNLPDRASVKVSKISSYSLQIEGEVQNVSLYVGDLINNEICVIEFQEKLIKKK